MEGEDQRVNNIYEIPLTDPAAPPFGVPGSAGAMPPPATQPPPHVDTTTDYTQLPPPGAAMPPVPGPAPQPAAPGTEPFAGMPAPNVPAYNRSEEHTSELQSRENLVCRLLL